MIICLELSKNVGFKLLKFVVNEIRNVIGAWYRANGSLVVVHRFLMCRHGIRRPGFGMLTGADLNFGLVEDGRTREYTCRTMLKCRRV